ncbi:MAG: hypothetical protein IT581_06405 [Verrucomicrobiales bacterium]|nr:hypothetical protein [Verrucomicrobiales bacterium]
MLSTETTVLKAIQTIFQLVGIITSVLWVLVQFGDRLWKKSDRNGYGDQVSDADHHGRNMTQILDSQASLRHEVDELRRAVDDLESGRSGTDEKVEDFRRALAKCNQVVAEIQRKLHKRGAGS